MRQALNNLQSTYEGFGFVKSEKWSHLPTQFVEITLQTTNVILFDIGRENIPTL